MQTWSPSSLCVTNLFVNPPQVEEDDFQAYLDIANYYLLGQYL